ncbi:MAG TPA: DUF58 domain-containing protein [Candidatus Dormibacteraeota bacterium]
MARAAMATVLAVAGFFAFIDGSALGFALVYTGVLLGLVAFGWSWWSARSVSLSRRPLTGPYSSGETFSERFTVSNRGALPLSPVHIRDRSRITGYDASRTVALGPHQDLTWETAQPLRRGRHQLGPTEISLADPFGLFPRRLRFPEASTVLVYPALHPIPDLGTSWSAAGVDSGRGRGPRDLPPSASGVREHDPADGMSRIHWVSTARTGRLMSRTFDSEEAADLLIVLDLRHRSSVGEGPKSSLEAAVSAAASIAHAALRHGQAVSLLASDRHLSRVPAGRGQSHERRLLEALALAMADGQMPLEAVLQSHLPSWRSPDQLVIITSDSQGGWIDAVATSSEPGNRAVGVFVDAGSYQVPARPTLVPRQWRLVLDLWVIQQGDDLARTGAWEEEARVG